jgi:Mn2+/Fe2+ NRAMP family transporter
LVIAAGAFGLALLVVALAGFVGALPWSLGLVGGAFVVVDSARAVPVLAAPLAGAGLLLVAELAYASRELARGSEERPGRRVRRLAGVTVAALGAAAVPAVATGVSPPSGLAASFVALGASAAVLLPPVLLLRGRD